MSAVDATAPAGPMTGSAAATVMPDEGLHAEIGIGTAPHREKFIPVTPQALMDRLAAEHCWGAGEAAKARRFFHYLAHWRQQSYGARLLDLQQTYEPFSPDSDLLITRAYNADERASLQKRLMSQLRELFESANFERVDAKDVHIILTKDSHYGLDLHVDLHAFEEIMIYTRGAVNRTESRRSARRLYLVRENFEVPIFQRLLMVFKLKPVEVRVREVMREQNLDRKSAEKHVRRMRSVLPANVKSDYVYIKLFKNMPRSDLEMCFPNTKVRFRLFDKIKLGVTAGGGLGMGVFGTASKIAVAAANPIALAGAVLGLGGIAVRQASNFVNQRNRYMVKMVQNLYFHALADNRGVMTLLADRAAEEDTKEDMLLYAVLAKETANVADLKDVDAAIERYLLNTFGISVNFDVQDAMRRLVADGIVTQHPDGTLTTLAPADGAKHIDALWDGYLDNLPDSVPEEGHEFGNGL